MDASCHSGPFLQGIDRRIALSEVRVVSVPSSAYWVQVPLSIILVERETDHIHKLFRLHPDSSRFIEEPPAEFKRGKPCESPTPGMYTCDLRIEAVSYSE